jgi:hypothetical protein
MTGNHPSNAIMATKLTPGVLGQLVAAYEDRVFTLAVVWGINPFDQWGVELGKVLAGQLGPKLQTNEVPGTTPTARPTPWSGCFASDAANPPGRPAGQPRQSRRPRHPAA